MKPKEFERLKGAGRRLHDGGLVAGTLGGAGVRGGDGAVTVTGDGSRLGDLDRSDLVALDEHGLPLNGCPREPSQDSGIFNAVLAVRPEAGSVIRVHSPYATALAHQGRKKGEKWKHLMEHLGGVAFIPYYRPGTAGLAGAVADAMRDSRVAIIENQGPVVWGTDVDDAVDVAEALEATAKIIFILSNNGARSGK